MPNNEINMDVQGQGSASVSMNPSVDDAAFVGRAEAWAVGKRNGTDVPSTDPAYHNNAKYYAADAAASAADAQQYTAAAVHTWLENNVDPETGYVLDRTLSEKLAAAPADMVGDLKSEITQDYNTTKGYDIFDIVFRNNKIRKANRNISSPAGAFNGDYWDQNIDIANVFNQLFKEKALTADLQFNIFDEIMELGSINSSGKPTDSTTNIRCKNPIFVLPNTKYYIKGVSTAALSYYFYDSNMDFISGSSGTVGEGAEITSPANAYAMRIRYASQYGTTYNNDTCVSFSQEDTTISPHNGQYVKHRSVSDILALVLANKSAIKKEVSDRATETEELFDSMENVYVETQNLFYGDRTETFTTYKEFPITLSAGDYSISVQVETNDTYQQDKECRLCFYNGSTRIEKIQIPAGVRQFIGVTLNSACDKITLWAGATEGESTGDVATWWDLQIVGGDPVPYVPHMTAAYYDTSEINNKVPSYYRTAIKTKMQIINATERDTSVNSDSFIFITDYHRQSNAKNSPSLVEYLMKNTGTHFVMFGGDAQDFEETYEKGMAETLGFKQDFEKVWGKMFFNIGNHEFNDHYHRVDPEHYPETIDITYGQINALMQQDKEFIMGGVSSVGDYWFDNKAKKIRYFMLGCDKLSYMSDTTTMWALSEFALVPAGYKIVVFSHLSYEGGQNALVINKYIRDIGAALDALNNRGSYSWSSRDTSATGTYDYSGSHAEACIIIGGHTHYDADYSYTISNTIPTIQVIATTTDACENEEGSLTRTVRTVNEQAFDHVKINIEDKYAYFTRIGAGKDRIVNYNPVSSSGSSVSLTSRLSGTLTWTSKNTGVATVSGGTVLKVAAGTARIVATDANGNYEIWTVVFS